jgi:rhodanese-related sulfurtransferase
LRTFRPIARGCRLGAANLPVGELPERLAEINALKDRPVILVCRTDKRSATAAALLRDAGFRDVGVLRGGMEQWNQKGLPVGRHTDLEHTGITVAPVRGGLDAGTGIIPNLGKGERDE